VTTRSAKLGGSAAGIARYLNDEAELIAGYYSDAKRTNDQGVELIFERVWGKAAENLGITEGVTADQFADLLAGRWNGEQLTGTGYRKVTNAETGEITTVPGVHTPAVDFVHAWDKSISVAMIRMDPELRTQVIDAAVESVHDAFTELQATARTARVTTNGVTERVPADLVGVITPQFTARPTEESVKRGVPDPHLHVHVTMPTMCQVGEKTYTLDEYGIRKASRYVDSIAQAQFARRLESLGVELEYSDFDFARNGSVSWQVKDISRAACQHYSTNGARSLAIRREFEERYGRPMRDAELTQAMRVTRHPKTAADKAQDARPVWERWSDDLREYRLALPSIKGGPEQNRASFHARTDELTRRLLSPNGLCREDATFSGDTIRPAVARCAMGLGLSVEQCQEFEAEFTERLIPVRTADDPRNAIWTTATIVEAEQKIAKDLARRQKAQGPKVSGVCIDKAVRVAEKKEGITLDAEQKALIGAMCSARTLTFAEAEAGAGKGTASAIAADAVRRAYPDARVIVTARAGAIAERTGKRLAADLSGSVESVETMIPRMFGKLTPADVVIVDESSTLDTFTTQRLLKAAGKARVTFLGDPGQLGAIGASGWYADATRDAQVHELHTVHRHRNPDDLADWRLIRQGKTTEAVGNLADRGKITVSEDPAHKLAEVTGDYKGLRDEGRKASDVTMLVDTANTDLDILNRFAQHDRRQRGEIGSQGFQVHDEEQGRDWTIHRGDQIIFLTAVQGAGGGMVRRGFNIIRGVESQSTRNGMTGTVKDISTRSGSAHIELEDGTHRVVQLQASAQRQPVGLSYAVHASKFQGAENNVILSVPGLGQTSNNSAYSMATRSRDETRFYLDTQTHTTAPLQTFADAIQVPEVQRSASWHLRRDMLSPAEAAETRFHTPRMAAEGVELAERLEADHGIEAARTIVNSDGYPALAGTWAKLRTDGLDADSMLDEAYRERSLAGAQDPAAVLSWRLGNVAERPAPEGARASQRMPEQAAVPEHPYQRPRHLDRERARESHGIGLGL
jgi:conjugative relaxase-like TrwC/TraI family protein